METIDFPLVTTVEERRQVAKIGHYCSICGGYIPPRSTYIRYAFRNHDNLINKLEVVKSHIVCPE